MTSNEGHGPPPPVASPATLVPALRSALGTAEGRILWAGSLACVALLALIFEERLRHLFLVWSTDENYSHGFLVPWISLYFANEASRRGPVPVRSGVGWAVAMLLAAIAGRLANTLVPIGLVADLALVIGVAGLVAMLWGAGALRRYAFPLFFLVFMIPLPTALYSMIASPLQLWVSRVASVALNGIGIPVLREGNTMTLPGEVRLFVAEACSGMRQLTGFLALTTAVAFLARRPWWYRGLVVASSIPIALAANLARVTLTGWIMYHNPVYAMGTFHTAEGLLMMGFGLLLLWGGCRLLDLLVPPADAGPAPADEPGAEEPAGAFPALHRTSHGPAVP